jgi:pyridoxal phosphate enzyme (YggS family)
VAGPAQRVQGALGERIAAARARIAAAAERGGRDPAAVLLVPVTKAFAADVARAAYDLGCRDLGENRVQEAAAKAAELPGDVRWHLIGHLQTNKVSRAAPLFSVVHSVDSERVAAALAERRPDGLAPLDVLVEVELTGIAGHTGTPVDQLGAVVEAVRGLPRLRLCGLMTMAPRVRSPELARPTFVRLRRLRDEVQERVGAPLPELSMGMSDDFEVAVEEGATIVRLGRTLFGERPPRA